MILPSSSHTSPEAQAESASAPSPAPAREAALFRAEPKLRFYFQPGVALKSEIHRVLTEQIQDVSETLRIPDTPGEEGAHAVRSCCRKMRACWSLVRGADAAWFEREKSALRSLAGAVPSGDDTQDLLAALDQVLVRHRGEFSLDPALLEVVRREILSRPRPQAPEGVSAVDVVHRMEKALERFERSQADWEEPALLAQGFRAGYRKARHTFEEAGPEASAEVFRSWHKAVRLHRIQVQLLRCAWPAMMNAWRKELKALETLLKDDHALHTLGRTLELSEYGPLALAPLRRAVARRRGEVRRSALAQGRRLFSEKPQIIQDRFSNGWAVAIERARASARPGGIRCS